MDHHVFVEKYRSNKIAVDVDKNKAGFMYGQPGLIPQEFRTKQALIRTFAFGGCLLCVTMFFFIPWWAALCIVRWALYVSTSPKERCERGAASRGTKSDSNYKRIGLIRQSTGPSFLAPAISKLGIKYG